MQLVIFALIPLVLSLGIAPAFSLQPSDIETECREGQVLVYRIIYQDYICTSESAAALWVEHGMAKLVSEIISSESPAGETDTVPETPPTPETDTVPETPPTPETDTVPETPPTPETDTVPETPLPVGIDNNKKNNVSIVPAAGNISMLIGVNGSIGGNIGVSAGTDGMLIVDGGIVSAMGDIKSKLNELKTCDTCDNVKFLVNTHWHFDHVENNASFEKDGAVIVAHSNARDYISNPQQLIALNMKFDASPKEALPVITFDDSISIHFNDEHVKITHIPDGHTDSDIFVHFVRSNVIHLGDHFFNGMFPFVDVEHGGSLHGLTANVKSIIDNYPSDLTIIPGHGPLASMDDLIGYHNMITNTTKVVQDQMTAGKTLQEIQTAGLSPELQSWGTGLIDEPTWIGIIHAALSA